MSVHPEKRNGAWQSMHHTPSRSITENNNCFCLPNDSPENKFLTGQQQLTFSKDTLPFLRSNKCNDPLLSPHTTTADSEVPALCSVEGFGKISIADAQRCLEVGKTNEHRGVTSDMGSPSLYLMFHHVICPSGPQEKRCRGES